MRHLLAEVQLLTINTNFLQYRNKEKSVKPQNLETYKTYLEILQVPQPVYPPGLNTLSKFALV